MTDRPSLLCPVDFSEASRGALRYAVALAEHFYAALTLALVDDPLLAASADITYGAGWMKRDSLDKIDAFVKETFKGCSPVVPELTFDVATGKAAPEILRIAGARHVDLIVMSTHGRTGARKWLLGSTTERVLRETSIPVLVTRANMIGPQSLEAVKGDIRCVLAPVDLSEATTNQIQIACGLAEAFGASLIVAHVLEPLYGRPGHESVISRLRASRRVNAGRTIRDLIDGLPPIVRPSLVLVSGDPAEEIVRLARRCDAGIVVMSLHASVGGGPRMGSVTYRVLCQGRGLVLAIPPRLHDGTKKRLTFQQAEHMVARG